MAPPPQSPAALGTPARLRRKLRLRESHSAARLRASPSAVSSPSCRRTANSFPCLRHSRSRHRAPPQRRSVLAELPGVEGFRGARFHHFRSGR